MRKLLLPLLSGIAPMILCLGIGCSACGGAGPVEEREVGAQAASDSDPLVRAAIEAGAPKIEDRGEGLLVEIHAAGSGDHIEATDTVHVHYDAFLADAPEEPFSSTHGQGTPFAVRLTQGAKPRVIEGLRRGMIGLRPGARATLRIPAPLAWGHEGSPAMGVPADATVVFDVQILSVE